MAEFKFPEKFTVYAVVSVPQLVGLDSLDKIRARIEEYHLHEHMATAAATKLNTWKDAAVVEQQMDANDLVRVLNQVLKEKNYDK